MIERPVVRALSDIVADLDGAREAHGSVTNLSGVARDYRRRRRIELSSLIEFSAPFFSLPKRQVFESVWNALLFGVSGQAETAALRRALLSIAQVAVPGAAALLAMSETLVRLLSRFLR
jgi:hypothetical protein